MHIPGTSRRIWRSSSLIERPFFGMHLDAKMASCQNTSLHAMLSVGVTLFELSNIPSMNWCSGFHRAFGGGMPNWHFFGAYGETACCCWCFQRWSPCLFRYSSVLVNIALLESFLCMMPGFFELCSANTLPFHRSSYSTCNLMIVVSFASRSFVGRISADFGLSCEPCLSLQK